jgi:hypothetical protein
MSRPDFNVEIFQNEFLPDGGRQDHAIISVTSSRAVKGEGEAGGRPAPTAGAAEIIIDCTVRLKSKVTDADEVTLDTRSSKTVRVRT